ncbi:MAG: flagellar filament capping protein FliD [Agathobacter sp.]|nr:flagellar filament capping protein FliD [Agathobacter sp.]
MAIRLSGLTSGMDTDAIVQEMVKAYSMKTEKYEKAATKLTWKQDAWKNLNTKIYGLYTNVSNLRFSSAYNLRKASVSDATKATVSANSDAVTGTQTLNILKTAQASYMTGGQLGKDITADSKLSDLGYSGNSTNITFKTADGTTQKINVTKDTKISEFIQKLKDAGVNASFDANNHRIFVNAKKSGEESDFTLLGEDADSYNALKALGLDSALIKVERDADGNIISKEFTEEAGSFAMYYEYYKEAQAKGQNDPDYSVLDYMKEKYEEYKEKFKLNDELKIQNKKDENSLRVYQNLNALYEKENAAKIAFDNITTELQGVNASLTEADVEKMLETVGGMEFYDTKTDGTKTISSSTVAELQRVYAENHADEGLTLSKEDAEAMIRKMDGMKEDVETAYKYVRTSDNITEIDIEANNQKIAENTPKMEALEQTVADQKTQMAEYEKFIKDNADMAAIKTEKEDGTKYTDEEIEGQLKRLADKAEEAARMMDDANVEEYTKGGAIKIVGSKAEIQLNGVTYTSESNNFTINGLSINALAKTDGEITISTSVDTQGIYDKVKDFLTEYNNVINEMTKLYNADSAGDYEPLTDEEKEAMSDEQIEKWENKIKDSLLRRDTTLNSILSVMVNSMSQTIEIDGETLSLSTFGIQTLGFLNAPKNEHYAYHIDGDEDDENTSGKKDKLMAAIEQNPEQVEEFMKKLSENLYKAVDNKMKSSELSSAYKVYNDKEMDREAKKYAEAIAKWEEKVKDKEDYYFKQFSNMEVALSKLQSQTSSISGLLGM